MLLKEDKYQKLLINSVKIGLSIVLLTFLGSCVTNKRAVYTQSDPSEPPIDNFETSSLGERIILPDDELFIRVSSFDEEENFFLQLAGDFVRNENTNLVTYPVKNDGYVRIPYVGDIQLQNLTLDEAANKVESALEGYLNQPTVFMKFVNKYVTVLGEVTRPGRYDYPDEFINVFQALGLAGDISYYGNRNRVMIVREENDVIQRTYIDLTDENIFSSPYYYLLPSDIVYVQPLKRRKWGIEAFPFSLILSSLTFTLVVLQFFTN